ncbi:ABC transporter permease subunit [Rhizobium lusitanum]|uniref:ABC transporter permease subunit n=1 Tax=Rhizobium lusitanum TaxID=293958 RepID=A0A6L9UDI8_9HYPH|nr:ABC transporter permease [Rhizobium lusitanum]NEI73684.1 ABC transporter permease subunit [Rhizobium lusitanum]
MHITNEHHFKRLERSEKWVHFNLLLPCLLFLTLFFFLPISIFLLHSVFDPSFTLEHFTKAFSRPVYMAVLLKTLKLSFVTTVVTLALGYPVAFVLTYLTGRLKTIVFVLIVIPFWTNILVRMFAWMALLGSNGVINSNLVALGIIDQPLSLLYNFFAVVLGMTHYMLPFMILPCYATMEAIPRNLTNAAANLGATPFTAFRRIFFPLSLPGAAAGCLLVFILSLGFYITPALLGGPQDTMFAQLIEVQINQTLDWGFAAALSTILVVITMILYLAYNWILDVDKIYRGEAA